MAQFLARAAWRGYEVCRVFVAESRKRFVYLAQLNRAVRVQVSTLRIPLDQFAARQEGLSTTVIPRLEVNLG
jgi:hypothetical protein